MQALVAYVETCSEQINQRIQDGKEPSSEQLDKFVTGAVSKIKELVKSAPAYVQKKVAEPWDPCWEFEANTPGPQRERLDPAALIEILNKLQTSLTAPEPPQPPPFDVEPIRAYVQQCGSTVNQRIQQGKEPSREQLDKFIADSVGKFNELVKEAPAEICDIVGACWMPLWDFDQNSPGPERDALNPKQLLDIFRKIRELLPKAEASGTATAAHVPAAFPAAAAATFIVKERPVEALRFAEPPEDSCIRIDDTSLVASTTYTNEESHLNVLTPQVTYGKRWAAFEVLQDPQGCRCGQSLVHVGVIRVEDYESWGYAAWTCEDDTPQPLWKSKACPARFIALGSGMLEGSGYGAETHGNEDFCQPDHAQIRSGCDGRCLTSCKEGDKIGVLVDCNKQSVLFFKNGEQWGPGYASGVAPPLYFTVNMFLRGEIKVLPDEPMPAGHAAAPLPVLQVHISAKGGGALHVVCNTLAGEQFCSFDMGSGSNASNLLAEVACKAHTSPGALEFLKESGESVEKLNAPLMSMIRSATS